MSLKFSPYDEKLRDRDFERLFENVTKMKMPAKTKPLLPKLVD